MPTIKKAKKKRGAVKTKKQSMSDKSKNGVAPSSGSKNMMRPGMSVRGSMPQVPAAGSKKKRGRSTKGM